MDAVSDRSVGKIVVARVWVDGQEYAIVAVGPEVGEDRILTARTASYYGGRLYAGLPVLLASKDALGRTRFLGGSAAESLQRAEPLLDWKTLYEDAPSRAEPAA